MAWRLTQCRWRNRQRLDALLADGWEPFAVSETSHDPTVWLREEVARADAVVVEPPRRFQHEAEVAHSGSSSSFSDSGSASSSDGGSSTDSGSSSF
jgi:hypothetical protein